MAESARRSQRPGVPTRCPAAVSSVMLPGGPLRISTVGKPVMPDRQRCSRTTQLDGSPSASRMPELLGKVGSDYRYAALPAQFNRASAPSPSSRAAALNSKSAGVKGGLKLESRTERAQGYRKEAERYAQLARAGQRDITNFVHKRLAERFARMAEDLERLGSERTRRHLLYGE
jgi:hypothetical protein